MKPLIFPQYLSKTKEKQLYRNLLHCFKQYLSVNIIHIALLCWNLFLILRKIFYDSFIITYQICIVFDLHTVKKRLDLIRDSKDSY